MPAAGTWQIKWQYVVGHCTQQQQLQLMQPAKLLQVAFCLLYIACLHADIQCALRSLLLLSTLCFHARLCSVTLGAPVSLLSQCGSADRLPLIALLCPVSDKVCAGHVWCASCCRLALEQPAQKLLAEPITLLEDAEHGSLDFGSQAAAPPLASADAAADKQKRDKKEKKHKHKHKKDKRHKKGDVAPAL